MKVNKRKVSLYGQIFKACLELKNDRTFNAWGIAASPKILSELHGESRETIFLHGIGNLEVEKLFGLVMIPCEVVEKNKVYIVSEALGRIFLGEIWAEE